MRSLNSSTFPLSTNNAISKKTYAFGILKKIIAYLFLLTLSYAFAAFVNDINANYYWHDKPDKIFIHGIGFFACVILATQWYMSFSKVEIWSK